MHHIYFRQRTNCSFGNKSKNINKFSFVNKKGSKDYSDKNMVIFCLALSYHTLPSGSLFYVFWTKGFS